MRFTPAARLSAFVIATIGAAALAVQIMLLVELTGSVAAALWRMGRFFTILTNILVLTSFACMTVRNRALPAPWLAGLTLWIAIVGVVYHLLLAGLAEPDGLAWWTDQAFHTAVPVLCVLWWIAFAPKEGLAWPVAFAWLTWPLAYMAYALGRGALDGIYPYPFVDVAALGYGGVARNAVGLAVGFTIGGLALVAIAKRLTR